MTFILSEDKALRDVCRGVTVHDQKADASIDQGRNVPVWFGQPDQEVRDQQYPYITIDMVDISRDPGREHRGKTNAEYLTPEDLTEGKGWEIHLPIPVNIDYQITTYARQPRHDREILSQLLHTKLPFRFGQLELDDNTLRRLEVLDVAKRDITEQGKRLFVNAFTVRVTSEIAEVTAKELFKVQTVVIPTPTSTYGTLDRP
jgi:hypothetical protein